MKSNKRNGHVVVNAQDLKSSCHNMGEGGARMLQQDSIFSKQTSKPCLFSIHRAEHHFSKANVMPQLEEVEDCWPMQREIPQDTLPGKSQAYGSFQKG